MSGINMEKTTVVRIKTKVIRINAKNQEMIMIAGQGIAEVDEFSYLGATLNVEGGGMKTWKTDSQKWGVHLSD